MVIYKTQAEGFTKGFNLEIGKKITLPQHKNETFYIRKMEIGSGVDAEKRPKRKETLSSSIFSVFIHTQPFDWFQR